MAAAQHPVELIIVCGVVQARTFNNMGVDSRFQNLPTKVPDSKVHVNILSVLSTPPYPSHDPALRRTAAAKLFPHCIFRWANKMDACRPRFISLPVNQPQLLESVADPTEMVFQSKAVDLEWHKEHCKQPKQLKAAADAAGQGGEAARALLPECGEGWEGRRPIPLLPVELVPGFAGLMDWVHSEVFLPLLAYHANTRRS